MKLKNAINWFEIPVNNYERAIDFYETVLDIQLKREKMEDVDFAIFPADETAIAGALIKADFQKPDKQGCLVYLNAEGMMDEAIQRAKQKGGDVYMGKTSIGENGYIPHISDSEGNKIALHSMTE
ncbi:MAG TPA: VOC family protein [Gammaproteobacteria bacterium]|nr:VOC family protein [Gammaproteobacteria bacterium]